MKKTRILLWFALVLFFSPAIFAQSGTLTPEERSDRCAMGLQAGA
jgi:hypothetical protein